MVFYGALLVCYVALKSIQTNCRIACGVVHCKCESMIVDQPRTRVDVRPMWKCTNLKYFCLFRNIAKLESDRWSMFSRFVCSFLMFCKSPMCIVSAKLLVSTSPW